MIKKATEYKNEIYQKLTEVYNDENYTWFFVEDFSTIDGVMKDLDKALISIDDKTKNIEFLLFLDPIKDGMFLHTINFGNTISWISEFSKYVFEHNYILKNYKYLYFKYCEKNTKVYKRNERFFGSIQGSSKIIWKNVTNSRGEVSKCTICRVPIEEYKKKLERLKFI